MKTIIQSKKILRIFSHKFFIWWCWMMHFDTPDERFCREDGKMSLKRHFSPFLVQKIFLGLFFGTRLANLLPFTDKKTKFHASSSKTKKKQSRSFLKKSLFSSANWSLCSGECWFVNYNEIKGRKVHLFHLNYLFWIFASKKSFLGVLFWTFRLHFGQVLLNFRPKKVLR